MISTMNAFTLFTTIHIIVKFSAAFLHPRKTKLYFLYNNGLAGLTASAMLLYPYCRSCYCWCYCCCYWSYIYKVKTDRSHYLQHAFMPIWHKIELRRKIMDTHNGIYRTYKCMASDSGLNTHTHNTIKIEYHLNLYRCSALGTCRLQWMISICVHFSSFSFCSLSLPCVHVWTTACVLFLLASKF